ncbi:MAG: hypothetical protein D6705_16670, partial [Deltaproteobacteria bacterium]
PGIPDPYVICGVWRRQFVIATASGDSVELLSSHVGEVGGYRVFVASAAIADEVDPNCTDTPAGDFRILVAAVP